MKNKKFLIYSFSTLTLLIIILTSVYIGIFFKKEIQDVNNNKENYSYQPTIQNQTNSNPENMPNIPQNDPVDFPLTGIIKSSNNLKNYYLDLRNGKIINLKIKNETLSLSKLANKKVLITAPVDLSTNTIEIQDISQITILPDFDEKN
ncbi:MAG: hypothetical protein N2558_02005 [Patescibacteria group bacterium]|nr:hypothetical protein [Patescibacteria group bacterium]